jgi:hypothetical protein
MKSKTLASTVRVLSLFVLVSGTCALAQESGARADWHGPRGLVGTWRLQVTPAYCPGVITGKLAGPSQALVSFAGDGTLTNTFDNSLFGYDTPGHGYWWKADDDTYRDVFELLIVNPPTTSPYVPGTQKTFATITLVDENNYTAEVTSIYFNSVGTVYLTKCSTLIGSRLNDSPTEP